MKHTDAALHPPLAAKLDPLLELDSAVIFVVIGRKPTWPILEDDKEDRLGRQYFIF